jgi:1-pyrroline-5-carboxylate dehydrogenase
MWNMLEYRALEGFVFAVHAVQFHVDRRQPPTAPRLMGNTVVWKPARRPSIRPGSVMELLEEAGCRRESSTSSRFRRGRRRSGAASEELAGVHFTGSTAGFPGHVADDRRQHLPLQGLPAHRRETGGKDFVFAHPRRTSIAS